MIKIFPDAEAVGEAAAEMFVEIAGRALRESARCAVALAGGSTPRRLYQNLAGDRYRRRLDWSKIFFFLGDERHVPPDHTDSNYRMARESLFEPLSIDAENIFRWRTELSDPQQIAEDYESQLKTFFDLNGPPNSPAQNSDRLSRFDLVLLGLGADAHTASLFPSTDAVRAAITAAGGAPLAAANRVEKLGSWRLTLTFPVINRAANIVFLVTGEEKAGALREVLEGARRPETFPAQMVAPKSGRLFWLVDEKAAQFLQT